MTTIGQAITIWLAAQCAAGAVALTWHWIVDVRAARRRPVPRDQRWDSTEDEVAELPRVLRGVVLDVHDVPVVAVPAEPEPLRSREPRHARPDIAETPRWYIGRHRAVGERDPRLAALLEPTQAYAAIVEALTGRTLPGVGPREADIHGRRSEGWMQDTLPVEVGRG